MGPGTHISSNIRDRIKPSSYNDAIAMTHDINYLLATGDAGKLENADDIAIRLSDHTPQGYVMKAGLELRKALGLKTSENQDRKEFLQILGNQLRDEVLGEEWVDTRTQYGYDRDWFLP